MSDDVNQLTFLLERIAEIEAGDVETARLLMKDRAYELEEKVNRFEETAR